MSMPVTISYPEWRELNKRLEALEAANLQLQLKLTKAEGEKVQNDHVHEVLTCFDFSKVHQAMEALDWKWKSGDYDYHPTMDQLKESAIRSMRAAIETAVKSGEESMTGTGGFMAYGFPDGSVQLDFVVESWNTTSEDDNA